jgi:hypothetical protein
MRNAPFYLLTFVVALLALAGCDPSLNVIQVKRAVPTCRCAGPRSYAPRRPKP